MVYAEVLTGACQGMLDQGLLGEGVPLLLRSPSTLGCNTSSGLAIFSAVRSSQQSPARGCRMKPGFRKQSQPAKHFAYGVRPRGTQTQ